MPLEVIGLTGRAGVGKDFVADWFGKKGFAKLSFASPMKVFAKQLFEIPVEVLWGESKLRNEPLKAGHPFWSNMLLNFPNCAPQFIKELIGYKNDPAAEAKALSSMMEWLTNLRTQYPDEISARVILQTMGTDWGRETVDQMIWVDYAMRVTVPKAALLAEVEGKPLVGAVFPDCRFKNEIQFIQARGGHVIRIYRAAMPEPERVGVANHASEEEQGAIPDSAFDLVLNLDEGVLAYPQLERAFELRSWKAP